MLNSFLTQSASGGDPSCPARGGMGSLGAVHLKRVLPEQLCLLLKDYTLREVYSVGDSGLYVVSVVCRTLLFPFV